MRRDVGEVGGRRLHDPSPRVHRRLEGHVGRATPTPVALAARRQDEQRAAARRLAGPAAGEVRFLGYVDGELDSDLVGAWPWSRG